MGFSIARKCFIEQGSDLVADSAGNRIPAKSIIFCKKRVFIITKDGDIDKFSGEEMDVIYQASDKDFNFLETQIRELYAERNQSILTSIFRTITGTRYKTGKRQVAGIPPVAITPSVTSPTIVPTAATTPGTPVTTVIPVLEALAVTTVPDTPAIIMLPALTTPAATNLATITEREYELSVP